MSEPDPDKRRACVHEAGHAVLATKSDAANPERVWIEEVEGVWLGRTYKSDANLGDVEGLTAEVVAGWGGCQAEEVLLGTYNRDAAANDEAHIERMLQACTIPAADWSEIKMRARVSVNDLAGQHQVTIEAVAHYLYEHESINSEDELIQIIQSALKLPTF